MGTTSSSPIMKLSTVLSIVVLFIPFLVECYALYPEKPCDGTLISACASCDTVKLCITADTSADSLNPMQQCPASHPYCSMSASVTGAVCQESPDNSIAECAAPQFKCTGVGFFPDAYSCQTYYYCAKPAAPPEKLNCPDGFKFKAKVNACALSSTPCPTFVCNSSLTDAIFQPLPSNTQYYVYCSFDKTVSPPTFMDSYVLSCGEGANFNPTTQKCVFTCPKEGLYANTAYPMRYYQCYLNGGKMVYKDLACDAGQEFDHVTKECVMVKMSEC